jgi:hypothetical protein
MSDPRSNSHSILFASQGPPKRSKGGPGPGTSAFGALQTPSVSAPRAASTGVQTVSGLTRIDTDMDLYVHIYIYIEVCGYKFM